MTATHQLETRPRQPRAHITDIRSKRRPISHRLIAVGIAAVVLAGAGWILTERDSGPAPDVSEGPGAPVLSEAEMLDFIESLPGGP